MHSYSKSLITGAILGSTIAISLYLAAAAPGETGMPEEGLISNILTRIVEPSDQGTARNTNNLGNIPSADWQRNVTGRCPNNQWAVGVNSDNTIACRNW